MVVLVVDVVVVIVIVTVVVVFWVEDATGQDGVRMERHMTRTTNLYTAVESFLSNVLLCTFLSVFLGILGVQNLYIWPCRIRHIRLRVTNLYTAALS